MKKCLACGKEFANRHKEVKCCSMKCSGIMHRKERIIVKCDNCGKYNEKLKFRIAKTNFCNVECFKKYKKTNPPNKKAGYWLENGYKVLYMKGNQSIKEHIQIMENYIGRKLMKNECIHHINGSKLDNRLENLLLTTRSKHTSIHRRESMR